MRRKKVLKLGRRRMRRNPLMIDSASARGMSGAPIKGLESKVIDAPRKMGSYFGRKSRRAM